MIIRSVVENARAVSDTAKWSLLFDVPPGVLYYSVRLNFTNTLPKAAPLK